jgi:hypothetical protein
MTVLEEPSASPVDAQGGGRQAGAGRAPRATDVSIWLRDYDQRTLQPLTGADLVVGTTPVAGAGGPRLNAGRPHRTVAALGVGAAGPADARRLRSGRRPAVDARRVHDNHRRLPEVKVSEGRHATYAHGSRRAADEEVILRSVPSARAVPVRNSPLLRRRNGRSGPMGVTTGTAKSVGPDATASSSTTRRGPRPSAVRSGRKFRRCGHGVAVGAGRCGRHSLRPRGRRSSRRRRSEDAAGSVPARRPRGSPQVPCCPGWAPPPGPAPTCTGPAAAALPAVGQSGGRWALRARLRALGQKVARRSDTITSPR